jgi:hypothetical protein
MGFSERTGEQFMTIYGYARVSTADQSLASQDAQLHAAGCVKVYMEKISGARSDRPELAVPPPHVRPSGSGYHSGL